MSYRPERRGRLKEALRLASNICSGSDKGLEKRGQRFDTQMTVIYMAIKACGQRGWKNTRSRRKTKAQGQWGEERCAPLGAKIPGYSMTSIKGEVKVARCSGSHKEQTREIFERKGSQCAVNRSIDAVARWGIFDWRGRGIRGTGRMDTRNFGHLGAVEKELHSCQELMKYGWIKIAP